MPRWDIVKEISSNKVIVSTSIWVFIVPAIIKVASLLNTTLPGSGLDLITFPSTFSILYFSGVSFFLGAVTYNLFCPSIIKKYDSYSSFANNGENHFCLEAYINANRTSDNTNLKNLLDENIGQARPEDIDNNNCYCITLDKNKTMFTFEKDKLNEVFWAIYHFMLVKRCLFIVISLTFHFIGFIGLTYMFLYNLELVINDLMQ